MSTGMSDLGPNMAILATNGTNHRLLMVSFQYILTRKFVPFCANPAQYGPNLKSYINSIFSIRFHHKLKLYLKISFLAISRFKKLEKESKLKLSCYNLEIDKNKSYCKANFYQLTALFTDIAKLG